MLELSDVSGIVKRHCDAMVFTAIKKIAPGRLRKMRFLKNSVCKFLAATSRTARKSKRSFREKLADELYLLSDPKAEAAYTELTSQHPDIHEYRYRLASIYLEKGHTDKAEQILSEKEFATNFPAYAARLLNSIRLDKKWLEQNTDHSRPTARDYDLLILDNSFPCDLSGFRYAEFTEILKAIPKSAIFSSTWEMSLFDENITFGDSLARYRRKYPDIANRVYRFTTQQEAIVDVAYTVFLNNATRLWRSNPQFKTKRAVFTLYPGGGFHLNERLSDEKLKRLCDDQRVTKIITTQSPTYNYLLEKGFCEKERIQHIYGIPPLLSQFADRHSSPPSRALSDVMHVCFVAHWYGTHKSVKGIDVFSDVANRFADDRRFAFHLVGGWSPELTGIRYADNVFYHGVRPAEFFREFYSKMDVILSPNISSFELNNRVGSFDGFPTTTCAEAGAAGAAMFLTDSLGMNIDICGRTIFKPHEEFELISRDADQICDLLIYYAHNREKLAALGKRGRQALLREFGFDRQIEPRLALLKREMHLASSESLVDTGVDESGGQETRTASSLGDDFARHPPRIGSISTDPPLLSS